MKIILLLFFLSIFILPSKLINFKYSEIDASIIDVIWCGNSKEELFVLTDLNSVFKSEDKGFTWKKMNDIFNQKGAKELQSHENEVNL